MRQIKELTRWLWRYTLLYVLFGSLVDHGPHHRQFADGGVVGLTRFLRTRKQYGDAPSSWWPAEPGPSPSARAKGVYEAAGGRKSGKKRPPPRGPALNGTGTITSTTASTTTTSAAVALSNDGLDGDDNKDSLQVDGINPATAVDITEHVGGSTSGGESSPKGASPLGGKLGGKPPSPYRADHVCIDMNQILHGSFRTSSDPRHCVAKIFVGLDKIFRLVEPVKSLVLTFDGPAPFAKLQTQRNRRISSPENSLITPGTDFMNAMDDVILCYVLQVLYTGMWGGC